MSETLPMFPLNTVLFPGVTVPLHVFEERYRALVEHLLGIEDPAERAFGTVAIREGYEVGSHGAQSLFRIGVRMQLTEVELNPDGSYDIEAVGIERIQMDALDGRGPFPVGEIQDLPEPAVVADDHVVERARATFSAYRLALTEFREDPYEGSLPRDPEYLSWALAACAPLPMAERQALLEAGDAEERLILVTDLLRSELRAMNVIPSLPATDVARNRWSPN